MLREQRRLAAIVAAGVVGYSRLMGRDESGATPETDTRTLVLTENAIRAGVRGEIG
jgi:class 3 adenylate cyclase